VKTYGHDQETHQSDLEADSIVPDVAEDFQFGYCSCGLGYTRETNRC